MKHLVLLRGCPGSGKTELAADLYRTMFPLSAKEHGVRVSHHSADQYFERTGTYEFDPNLINAAHEACRADTQYAINQAVDWIFVHNTFTRDWEMNAYIKMGEDAGYRVHTLIVENRHGSDNVHNVPDRKVKQMAERFEVQLLSKERPIMFPDDFEEVLANLELTEQTERWHPEGNVYIHTSLVTGELIHLYPDNEELHWAGLFHDLGKINTTKWNEEKQALTAYGHEKVSVEYLEHYWLPPHINLNKVKWIVANHMRMKLFDRMSEKKRKKLSDHEWFPDLERFSYSDSMLAMMERTSSEDRKKYHELFITFLIDNNIRS